MKKSKINYDKMLYYQSHQIGSANAQLPKGSYQIKATRINAAALL